MDKWLSVIIPHYNSIDLLEILVKSIPRDLGIEIIIVDDKSTKDVEKIADFEKRHTEAGHVFMRNTTEKKGAGVCRNLAIEKATGEWIVFADADDYFVDGAFDIIKKATTLGKNLVYFASTSVYLESGELADRHLNYEKWIRNYCENPCLENELIMRYKFLGPVCKLIKRSIIGDIRFGETMSSEDVMFCTRLANSVDEIEVCPDVVYCITKSSGTLATQKNLTSLETAVDVFLQRYTFLREHLTKEEFDTLRLSGKMHLAKAFLDGYGIKEVFKILKKYHANGIKVFSVRMLIRDVKDLFVMLKTRNRDKKEGV